MFQKNIYSPGSIAIALLMVTSINEICQVLKLLVGDGKIRQEY